MTDIPEDVMKAAKSLDRQLEGCILVDASGPYISVGGVEAVARAIMAAEQRGENRGLERAARSALLQDNDGCLCDGYSCTCSNISDAVSAASAATARNIAAAIRSLIKEQEA